MVLSFDLACSDTPAGADHLDVVVHQPPRAGGVANLDQAEQLLVNIEDAARDLRRQRRIAPRPGDVLQRDELHHQHAVVRGLGDREMEVAPSCGEAGGVVDGSLRLRRASCRSLRDVLVGGVLGRKLGGEAFDRALRVHDLGGADAGEVELHRERLGEQPRIAARHPRAAALAHLDLGDAERLQACAARRARRSG